MKLSAVRFRDSVDFGNSFSSYLKSDEADLTVEGGFVRCAKKDLVKLIPMSNVVWMTPDEAPKKKA